MGPLQNLKNEHCFEGIASKVLCGPNGSHSKRFKDSHVSRYTVGAQCFSRHTVFQSSQCADSCGIRNYSSPDVYTFRCVLFDLLRTPHQLHDSSQKSLSELTLCSFFLFFIWAIEFVSAFLIWRCCTGYVSRSSNLRLNRLPTIRLFSFSMYYSQLRLLD